ncbi:alpha-E domain-containing protein [uncultured Alsobacter sp.]|uniref:alpha-E domain-containing protein n=1 Tax=uncultured Alsobacter sp. TaxID=1748258 RepID=UPI00260132EA|nr:alpha-E domain-containing protein [uncultured Alsobacter sp.]
MLSRTADNLYWVSRYVERAEFIARVLDATQRLSTLPAAYGGVGNEWRTALLTVGASEAYDESFTEVNERNVTTFLAFSSDNRSSIRSCIEIARQNARAVRTAITAEMWEAINGAYLELRKYDSVSMSREQTGRFLEWVKSVSLAFDGSAYRSMLRSDSYWFSRLGVYIERADNTARILDVKYHLLLPESERVGSSLDYFQWSTILREVSALTAYHWVYRESLKPWLVADLLILNRQMPRSLASSYENIVRFLDDLGQRYGRQGVSQRLSRSILTRLENTTINEVFKTGLHEFIDNFIVDNNKLGSAITDQYLV